MATRLIKKQLGSILLDNLLVPRMSKPVGVAPATQKFLTQYGLVGNSSNDNYFVGKMSVNSGQSIYYIYKYGHPMTYKSDTKDGKHHKGDTRMKHISSINEFKYWYGNRNNDVVASLRQFSSSLADKFSHHDEEVPNHSTDDEDIQNNGEPNNTDDDNSNL